MKDSLNKFIEQFNWNPTIENVNSLTGYENVILIGMGGSHLAAGLLKVIRPGINIYVHHSYGLPPYDNSFLKNALILISSYSGNTEETIDAYNKARELSLNVGVITAGGILLNEAKENNLPYIQLPEKLVPRMALGYTAKAIASFLNDEVLITEIEGAVKNVNVKEVEDDAKRIAGEINNIPLIYSSNSNIPASYLWKIAFNETSKIPAFYNSLPECDHNEIQGMANINDSFSAIFIISPNEDMRIQKRFAVMESLYTKFGMKVIRVEKDLPLTEWAIYIFLLGLWTSYELAVLRNVEPEQVPDIEEFKKQIKL